MIRINLTGDYDIGSVDNVDSTELEHLNAFLGALRGSVDSDRDAFLKGISDLVNGVRRKKLVNLELQISSELVTNKLTHVFRVVEI